MAIYAFDGTWNEDDDPNEVAANDTNVARFLDACDLPAQEEEYIKGVGTRFSLLGKTVGGAIGVGGKRRIETMLTQLQENYSQGDTIIDVIGFSRGAALALHFCNEIAFLGLQGADGKHVEKPLIRFLGLWDVVGSFGIPLNIGFKFQEKNPGYKLSVPENVQSCYHAMALDERREAFTVTRLNAAQVADNIEERWFHGVHSDVGGGNGNLRLSNIALKWMLQKAADKGLPINREKFDKLNDLMDTTAPVSKNLDPFPDPSRKVLDTDLRHQSTIAKLLESGQSASFIVGAGEKYSWTGIRLVEGGRYLFDFDPDQHWKDGDIDCGPGGWTVEQQADNLPWYKEKIINFANFRKRDRNANWLEVVGTVGKDDDICFRIGDGSHKTKPFISPSNDILYAFANDLKSKYDNNIGEVTIQIKRV